MLLAVVSRRMIEKLLNLRRQHVFFAALPRRPVRYECALGFPLWGPPRAAAKREAANPSLPWRPSPESDWTPRNSLPSTAGSAAAAAALRRSHLRAPAALAGPFPRGFHSTPRKSHRV